MMFDLYMFQLLLFVLFEMYSCSLIVFNYLRTLRTLQQGSIRQIDKSLFSLPGNISHGVM